MSWGNRRRGVRALAAVAVLVAACRSDRTDELLAAAPTLSPDLAAHLVGDDPDEFAAYARRTGWADLGRAMAVLAGAPPTDSESEFVRVERLAAPCLQRCREALISEFGFVATGPFSAAYDSLPLAARMECVRLLDESTAACGDVAAPAAARAARFERLFERVRGYEHVVNIADAYGVYASLLGALGRRDEIPRYLQLGIDTAERFGEINMECQLLGTLGFYWRNTEDLASMRQAWDRALRRARQFESAHEARILGFYSVFHEQRAQFAIARDLALEAQDRCTELGVVETELRMVLDWMKFFADLDCWDLVGRGLQRVELILRAGPPDARRAPEFELEGVRAQVLRARYSAHNGRCDDARELALAAAEHVEGWSLGVHRAVRVRLEAARALVACGLESDARPLLERGVRQCAEASILELADDYALLLARVYLGLGELDSCATTLATASPLDPRDAVERAILQLELARARGGDAATFAPLRSALHDLDTMAAALGASPENDMATAAHDDLRRLGHDLLPDAASGYGFEMRWRAPLRLGARFAAPAESHAAFAAGLARETQAARARLAVRDAIHCVYDVRDDGIVRFTVGTAGVTKQRLDADVADVRRRVQNVCAAFGRPWRESGPDTTWVRDLRFLASALLPAEVRRTDGPRLLLVTANGCLARLPFETLNVAATGYTPLLQRTDVARLHSWSDDAPAADATPALVICEPKYAQNLRRRHSALAEALPAASAEAASARALLSGAIGLDGAAATKKGIADRWERARIVYFAGHVVQDPDVPYLTFVPMAAADGAPEDDSYLDVADVRGADLRRCRLVVLSSCSSGAAYSNGWVGAPSLADAFIDAGARAVVATAWAVRDSTAAQAMHAFMRRYVDRGETDPIAALCEARRELAREAPDPRAWAAYSITIGRLPAREASATLFVGESSTRLPAPGRHR